MSHVINFDLGEFIAQIASATGPIYVQEYQTVDMLQGISNTITSHILVCAMDAHAVVHGCRIFVEHARLLGDKNAIRDAVTHRAAVAVSLLHAALPRPALAGKLLEAGMHEDLNHTVATHNLWRWSGDQTDAVRRALVSRFVSAEA